MKTKEKETKHLLSNKNKTENYEIVCKNHEKAVDIDCKSDYIVLITIAIDVIT